MVKATWRQSGFTWILSVHEVRVAGGAGMRRWAEQNLGGLLKGLGQRRLGTTGEAASRVAVLHPAFSTAQALVCLGGVSPSELSSLFAYLYIEHSRCSINVSELIHGPGLMATPGPQGWARLGCGGLGVYWGSFSSGRQ